MKVVFLIDYSESSGYGHINRSLCLASELIRKGISVRCLFSSRNMPTDSFEELSSYRLSEQIFMVNQVDGTSAFDFSLWNSILDEWKPDAVIIDSYSISSNDAKTISGKRKTIAFERPDLDGYCDCLIDFMPAKIRPDNSISGRTRYLSGPEYFICRGVGCSKEPRNGAILHTGGSYRYEKRTVFFESCAIEFRSRLIPITWLISCENDMNRLVGNGLATVNDSFRYFDSSNGSLWSEFTYVVGPPSSSLFESLIQGCVAITACTSESQNDSLEAWVEVGHLLHVSSMNSFDKKAIRDICALATEFRSEILEFAKGVKRRPNRSGSRLLADRLVQAVLMEEPVAANESYSGIPTMNDGEKLIAPCDDDDIMAFRNARNLEKNRAVSTSNQKISWLNHVRWWLRGDVHRYKLLKNGHVAAFIWFKEQRISDSDYLYGGWFPADNSADLSDAFEIVRWQIDEVAPKYPKHKWIATFAKSNKAIPLVNRHLGFVDADNAAVTAARIIFPGTEEEQKIMVYPA